VIGSACGVEDEQLFHWGQAAAVVDMVQRVSEEPLAPVCRGGGELLGQAQCVRNGIDQSLTGRAPGVEVPEEQSLAAVLREALAHSKEFRPVGRQGREVQGVQVDDEQGCGGPFGVRRPGDLGPK